MTLKEWEADVLSKPGAEGRVSEIEAELQPKPKKRELAHSDLRPRKEQKTCFVAGCDERILPSFSGRYCKAHHKAAEAWLSEERRLDNTEDGRRGWYLEWENGWDGAATEDPTKWDDVEAVEDELVDA